MKTLTSCIFALLLGQGVFAHGAAAENKTDSQAAASENTSAKQTKKTSSVSAGAGAPQSGATTSTTSAKTEPVASSRDVPATAAVAEPFTQKESDQGPAEVEGATLITLEEAHKRALASYPQLKNIDESIYQADMGIYQAWTMLMPNLTANASITLNQREVAIDIPLSPDLPPMNLVIQDKWAKSAGFAANLTLFNPQSIPLIKMAYDSYEKERLTAQIRRNDLLFAVTSAYYQAFAMKEMIRVAEENVAMAREFLRQATILKDAGQGTRIDVNRATIQLMASEKELENAKGSEQQALLALKKLIDEDGPIVLEGPATEVSPVSESLDSLKTSAVERRIELKEAAVAQTLANRSRMHTLTKFLPIFDITYNWSWSSAQGFSGSNVNWMLIFGAKWNIFLGGSRAVEYKIRQSQIRMASNNVSQTVRDIEAEVEKHHINVKQREKQLVLLDQQVILAEENHALISKQFQAGIVTSLDVTNAATELASKRIMLVYERLLFDLEVLTLRKSIGEYSALSVVPAS